MAVTTDLVSRIVAERLAASKAERREQHDRPPCVRNCGRPARLDRPGARTGPPHADGLCATCRGREDARERRAAKRAALAALPPDTDARTCHRCGTRLPVEEMTRLHLGTYQRGDKSKTGRTGVAQSFIWLCGACAEKRRQRDAHPEPHPAPARLLRVFLESDRAQGIDFDQAFDWSVAEVLQRLPADTRADRTERDQWRSAFEDMRPAWQRGYEGLAVLDHALDLDLLDAESAELSHIALVA